MNGQEIFVQVLKWVTGILQLIYWYLEALYRQFVPPRLKPIDGETILVTGAVGGIGRELCKHLVRSGSNINLVIWDLNLSSLEKLARELEPLGNSVKVFPFAVDISTKENIKAASKQVKGTVGRVTIIFNNAGIGRVGNFLEVSEDYIEKTIQINLMSHFWIIREFLPAMIAKNHGRIVNICSMGGLKASPLGFPYYAAKFGVNGYTESLKMELELFKCTGVHLTTVYPYYVKTPIIQSLTLAEETKKSKLFGSLQKFLEPADVARKTVEGMRREYEYIYLPPIMPLILVIDYVTPLKFQKMCQSYHAKSVMYKDAEDLKKCTPYQVSGSDANAMH